MKQRIISLILLASLAATATACDDSGTSVTETTVTDAPIETSDPLAEPELPEKNYNGYEFTIFTRQEGWGIYNNEHLVVEEETGEVLNDAIYNRNRMVEDKFNVKLTEKIGGSRFMTNEINQTVMANEDVYDLIIPTEAPPLGTDYLVDFNTLELLNLDKPWYNQNYIEASSVNGKLTSLVGSVMITHMDSVFAMLYNKKLATDYKLPDLYELVREGSWTLPKLFEVSKGVTADLNGDTVYDDRDRYAYVGLLGMGRLGSGVKLDSVIKDANDTPTLNIDNGDVIDKLTGLIELGTRYERDIYDPRFDTNTGGDGDAMIFRLFGNDQALFYIHGLGSVQKFRDMKSDFGVIPTPKLDEAQENYYIYPDIGKCMVIPITASDLERTSIVIEYMSWAGYTYLRPKYYESMLQSKYLRDDESVEMMDEYIFTNIGYTPQYGSATLINTINEVLSQSGNIASELASIKPTVEAELEKYLESLQ